jgi:O-antigen/teichoic acid export membrane protein
MHEPAEGTGAPKHSVGRSMAWLTSAALAQQVTTLGVGVLIRAILGPAKTGVWNLVEVWRQQCASITLGVQHAADRDMPALRAQGRHEEEAEVRSVTFSFTLGEAGAVAIAFWAYWAIARDGLDSDLAFGFALVPVMAIATSITSVYQLFLKNRKEFRLFSLLGIAQLVIDWSTVVLALAGGLRPLLAGLAVGWILRAFSCWLLVRRNRLFTIKLGIRLPRLKALLRLGLPLSVWGLGYALLQRLDSLVVGTALGTDQLGLYYLGPQTALALAALPTALSVISYPNLMETFGAGGTPALREHMSSYVRVTALVLSPIVAALGVFGVGFLITGLLPDFAGGLPPARVFVLSLLVAQSAFIFTQVLVAVRRVALLIAITAAALAVQAAILGIGGIEGLNLQYAAWSSVAGQSVMCVGLMIASARLLDVGRPDARLWIGIVAAWIVLGALLLGIAELSPDASGVLGAAALTAVQLVVFAALAAPVVWLADRSIVGETRELLRGQG